MNTRHIHCVPKNMLHIPISEHSIFFTLCQWKTWVHSVLLL